jgi:succinate dehydrogenase/fumarate reductase iron-sulfur protein
MLVKARVKIWRFDPSVDQEARYDTYELPADNWGHTKVIDVLRLIYEKYDPGLSFRDGCRQQLCRACAVMVNNKVRLACDAFIEKETIIEPLPNRRVIKDLVTD